MLDDRRVILALDMDDWVDALYLAREVRDLVAGVKVHAVEDGSPADLIGLLSAAGLRPWVDFKLWDVGDTVLKRYQKLWARGAARVSFATITSRGTLGKIMDASPPHGLSITHPRDVAGDPIPPQRIGITIPTDWDEDDLQDIGIQGPIPDVVERLAERAYDAGVRHFVCSPWEAGLLKKALPGAHVICPGIRPEGSPAGGQKRFATPAQAIREDADELVVGSPIYKAKDPRAVLEAINAEVAEALAKRAENAQP